jgi:hypothetical protein
LPLLRHQNLFDFVAIISRVLCSFQPYRLAVIFSLIRLPDSAGSISSNPGWIHLLLMFTRSGRPESIFGRGPRQHDFATVRAYCRASLAVLHSVESRSSVCHLLCKHYASRILENDCASSKTLAVIGHEGDI